MAYAVRGEAKLVNGKLDLALEDMNKAVELAPKDSDYYWYRAKVWKAKGEPKRALADLNESIRINPSTGSIAFFERMESGSSSRTLMEQ